MSNDPFGQFSNMFANEFAKQFGTAAINAWQEALTKSFTPAGGSTTIPGFADGFNKWFGQGEPAPGNGSPLDFFQQFIQQFPGAGTADLGAGNGYLQFSQYIQKYIELFSAGVDPAKIADQMATTFQESLDQFSNSNASPWMNVFQQFGQAGDPSEFFKAAASFFQNNPFHNNLFQGDFLKAAANFNFNDFSQMKSTAAVGPAREWQIAMQDVLKASERHRKAKAQMREHTNATFKGASKRFWQDFGHGEGELKSIREIYDYWVNCAEDSYAEIVMTDEYSRDFGESINSQANLKLKFSALLNRFLEMLNIPNRRELDGVMQQLSRMDKRLEDIEHNTNMDAAQNELGNAVAISELKKEIAQLRRELKSDAASRSEKPKTARKTPKRKQGASGSEGKKTDDPVPAKKAKQGNKTARKKSKDAQAAEFEITKFTSSKSEAH